MNNTLTLEQLTARAAITDLVHRYAKHIRDGNSTACEGLFTEDASFITREMIPGQLQSVTVLNSFSGREAVMNYLNRPEVRAKVCPSVSNLLIEVEGERASSSCLMKAHVWASGKHMLGEYHDTFRFDGIWRFTSRTYTMFTAHAAANE